MGSLFKARDFWQTKFNDSEEFDVRSLAVSNIDNDSHGQVKIIVGNFNGTLRIFNPKQKGFKPDDLLLEAELGEPILQVAAGNYFKGTNNFLAILHPRKIVIVSVQRQGSGAGENDPFARQFSIRKEMEHQLEHTAYNFVTGCFGDQTSHQQICVQSMDGQVAFFDSNKHMFSRFLPSTQFLLPGSLCYVPHMDCIITHNSAFEVDCYRYHAFAGSTGSQSKDPTSGRKVSPDWSLSVGEDVVDIITCRLTRNLANQQTDIVVLGEHSLFILKETGELRYNKRLDVHASCMMAYPAPNHKADNLIVGNHSQQLMIFDDKSLIWSAKTSCVPLSIFVAPCAKIDGMLLMLGDDNSLSVNYLGTDPANQPVQILESKELDYDAMDEEHRRLQQQIRTAVSTGKSEPTVQLQLSADVPPHVGASRTCTVMVHMNYPSLDEIENVAVSVRTTSPIMVDQHSHVVNSLHSGEQVTLPLTFGINSDGDKVLPTSLYAEVVACYSTPSGDPMSARVGFQLPLGIIGQAIAPVKNSNFKVTIDTNKPAPENVAMMFQDVPNADQITPNMLSFQYCTGGDCSILVSKNAGRYRVQSSTFEALWMLTSELIRRVKLFFEEEGGHDLVIQFTDNMPMPEFFHCIDHHFECRKAVQAAQDVIASMAHQFRSVQKRLLIRYKDRNPSPLTSLEALFEDTYRKVLSDAEKVEVAQATLEQSANVLSCAVHMVLIQVQYRFVQTFTEEDAEVLRNFMSPLVVDTSTQGWEEVTDASMTHLLRTTLSKTAKESSTMPQPLVMPPDTTKLKKHIAIVLDRIGKGASLREPPR